MRAITMNGYKRITKQAASRLYDLGLNVLFCPVNMRPADKYYNMSILENKHNSGNDETPFQSLINSFEFYNCTAETGKYTAFYIPENRECLHITFSNGSNPWIFYGNTIAIAEQLKKWGKNWNLKIDLPINNGVYNFVATEKGGF